MTLNILDRHAFAATDRAAWLALVDKALKGADFEQTLVSATDDGIAIQPLYDRLLSATPLERSAPSLPWTMSQRIDDPDGSRVLLQLADDLANGATGLIIVPDDSASGFGTGIGRGIDSGTDDAQALAGALAAATGGHPVSIRLEAGEHSASFADALLDAAGVGRKLQVHFGIDPFTPAAFHGRPVDTAGLASRFRHLQAAGHAGTILNADGRLIHNAGGTGAEELAVVAAAMAAYLRLLAAEGMEPAAVLQDVSLCLCADQNQFFSMAKLRAARLLFARIAETCGIDPALRPHVFAQTSYRMLTSSDPETNILRNTIAVFAAGTGGADEIAVLPHTLAHGIPDPLARRLARNTQLILTAESHLDHVADPSAGAGGIEALTDALAAKAWALFGDIERAGGIAGAIDTGRLTAMLALSRQERPPEPIVGTTLFAADRERPVAVLAPLHPRTSAGLRPVPRDEETAR